MLVDNRLSMFNAILSNGVTSSNYSSYMKNEYQQKINSEWSYATDVFTIQEEQNFGSMDWKDIEVRITHIINAGVGDKMGDDFRQIIFKSLDHAYGLGRRYQFDGNLWCTTNSDLYHYSTASAVIRRMNNSMNFYVNGILVNEPCIIDYKPYRTSLANSKVITLQEGRIYVVAQYNQSTKTIIENQRFLFGGRAFKTIYVENYLLNNTFDKDSAPLIELYMDINQVNPAIDDKTNNIANAYTQSITQSSNVITPNVTSIVTDDSQQFMVYNYDSHGIQTTNTFNIAASGVPNDYYTLTINSENSFTVNCLSMYPNAPLSIVCTNANDGTQVDLNVQLKGLF